MNTNLTPIAGGILDAIERTRRLHGWPAGDFRMELPDGDGGDGGQGGGDGGAGGGDGGAGGGQGGGAGAGDGGADGGAGGDGGQGGGDQFVAPKDQAEFDRMVARRINQVKSGFSDYEDLKAKAAKLDEIETANQSDLEKAQSALEAANKRAEEAEARAKTTAIRAAVSAAASKMRAADPDDVYALLSNKESLTVADDGSVEGAEEAVKALLEAKPHLVGKQTSTGDGDGGVRSGDGSAKATTLGDAVTAHYAKS